MALVLTVKMGEPTTLSGFKEGDQILVTFLKNKGKGKVAIGFIVGKHIDIARYGTTKKKEGEKPNG